MAWHNVWRVRVCGVCVYERERVMAWHDVWRHVMPDMPCVMACDGSRMYGIAQS